ncbi:type IX secretion system membrane protein PorP/SprF [Dokdonia sp. Hel_I_53]|uniref:PorP/SprF family type IX secretion system membrane protein n=1 Tax=Dokdonia sp. Hel_I_53 TaxID=1566287 RepID=UPI00119A8A7D|nr:type IX secretion system membrane protein PorP/SprF [Dokdonia sp. Hel_I_53]TVZ50979.1 type IX secretion system PorP/SprF family membrane protein [Dokdonia sp. Hel_I_53]
MKIKIFIIAAFCSFSTFAQQEPQYTQYMYNMGVVNPAYMINEPGLIRVGSLYRSQWVGLDGAPKTANVFGNIPLNERLELGINYVNDQIGNILTQNYVNANFAYRINVGKTTNLSFGLKLGLDNLSLDFTDQGLQGDDSFQNGQKNSIDIGAGLFLFDRNYYLGLSSPNVIPYEIESGTQDILYKKTPTLYFMGGYVYEVSDMLKVKPSTVVKWISGSPLTFDLSLNALYADRFELGVSYRHQDAIAALAGFNITQDLKIGYSYDFNTSDLNSFNNGSHEVFLIYAFDILGLQKRYISPRFY